MATHRPHPPSAQRILDAHARGHLPRTRLVGVAGGLLALGLTWVLRSDQLATHFLRLFSQPLEALALGRSELAYGALLRSLRELGALLGYTLLGACVGVGASVLLVQGFARASLRRPRSGGFGRLSAGRSAALAWSISLCVCGGAAVAEQLAWNVPWAESARTFVLQLAAFSLLCAIADVALARASWLRSLWLTRAEYLDEQRETFGAPELRGERERLARWLREPP